MISISLQVVRRGDFIGVEQVPKEVEGGGDESIVCVRAHEGDGYAIGHAMRPRAPDMSIALRPDYDISQLANVCLLLLSWLLLLLLLL